MTNWARAEREQLCDLMVALGPDAPTLCGPWTTRDLAAHLVLRDRRPDAAAGIVFGPLAGHTANVQRKIATGDWPALVALVRSGPPRWSPTAIGAVDKLVNTVEFYVHHEDVRRAQPDWQPRDLDDEEIEVLRGSLRRSARLLLRRTGVGVEARPTVGDVARLRKGEPTVTVSGPAGEILLFCFGRQGHARVALTGPPSAVEQLRLSRLGL